MFYLVGRQGYPSETAPSAWCWEFSSGRVFVAGSQLMTDPQRFDKAAGTRAQMFWIGDNQMGEKFACTALLELDTVQAFLL